MLNFFSKAYNPLWAHILSEIHSVILWAESRIKKSYRQPHKLGQLAIGRKALTIIASGLPSQDAVHRMFPCMLPI